MHRRFVTATLAFVLPACAATTLHAAPFAFHHSAAQAKTAVKLVSFSVRNDSTTALVLQAGEQQITVDPGKTAKLKVADGAQLTTVNATAKLPAGSVLTTVGKQLEGNTLAVS